MNSLTEKNKIPNEVYVKRYKNFIRLVLISKMLSKAKIIIHSNQK
jgi:hypothetical protein